MIPVNEPLLDGNEKKYLNECIDTGWISSEGPYVKKFEEQFSNYIGCDYGVAVCNGTAAVEVALHALGVSHGDEVILPSFTIISCAVAILNLGAIPVLVDINKETWTMDTSQIEAKITKNTKAIMAVHIYGHPVDMDPIMVLSEKYNIKVLEDTAESHGAEYYSEKFQKWMKCGTIGHASATSFYANKIITTGEGGMVLTSDPEVYQRGLDYRNLYFGKSERFNHEELGYNFRMTNLQAAIGVAQLEQVDRFVGLKRKYGEYYREKIESLEGVRFQPERKYAKSVYWMYSIELDNQKLSIDADFVRSGLQKYKIGTRPFFKGLHCQPVFHKMGLFVGEEYPNTDYAYKYGLYLPSGLTITKEKIDTVFDSLRDVLNKA